MDHYMNYQDTYSFAVSNANLHLKVCLYAFEQGNEGLAADIYLDYRWWLDYAENWIKNQQ